MNKKARQLFNTSFSNEKYQQMVQEIKNEFPNQLDFRIAESPVFVDRELKTKLLMVSNQIIDRIKKSDFIEKTDKAIPEKFRFENESKYPHFLALDYGITRSENNELEPQLIELQGFPSLFAYQSYLSGKYKKYFDITSNFSSFFNRLNAFSYIREMEKVLKPDEKLNTVLLEIYPEKQKTRLDFELSKRYWNLEVVCLSQVFLKGKYLFFKKGSEEIKIEQVYNRVIFDEIENKFPELMEKINLLKTADIKWISHPNWFYRISKYCLPLLKGAYVPESFYLNDLKEYPEDLENYVLKPLFSFAGKGVNLHPTKKILDHIIDKENYLLQAKVPYEPCIEDLNGDMIKTEIRLLFIWPEGNERPKLVTNLARLSRGAMIGVDHNKDFDWVGGSSAFFETN